MYVTKQFAIGVPVGDSFVNTAVPPGVVNANPVNSTSVSSIVAASG